VDVDAAVEVDEDAVGDVVGEGTSTAWLRVVAAGDSC
jgi:hypothetical protein